MSIDVTELRHRRGWLRARAQTHSKDKNLLISEMYPSRYLKAADVGRSRQLTVRKVHMEEVGQERETKPVMYFMDETRGLILNKTNCNAAASILRSADTANWVGKQLTLHVEAVHYAGRSTPGIRIRGGASPAQAVADDLDRDQVPF
jgi:hypothetical protein